VYGITDCVLAAEVVARALVVVNAVKPVGTKVITGFAIDATKLTDEHVKVTDDRLVVGEYTGAATPVITIGAA
jgi:hypothetical protein